MIDDDASGEIEPVDAEGIPLAPLVGLAVAACFDGLRAASAGTYGPLSHYCYLGSPWGLFMLNAAPIFSFAFAACWRFALSRSAPKIRATDVIWYPFSIFIFLWCTPLSACGSFCLVTWDEFCDPRFRTFQYETQHLLIDAAHMVPLHLFLAGCFFASLVLPALRDRRARGLV